MDEYKREAYAELKAAEYELHCATTDTERKAAQKRLDEIQDELYLLEQRPY